MRVVEDDADLGRRPAPHRVGDRGRTPTRARCAEGEEEIVGDPQRVAVGRLEREPHVVTAWRQSVLGQRLREHRWSSRGPRLR